MRHFRKLQKTCCKYQVLLISFFSLVMCLSCSGNEDPVKPDKPVIIDEPIDPDFPTNPQVIDTDGAVVIKFGAQVETITNPFENKGVTITHYEANVVVQSTATDTITYILTGTTPDGSLKIYSDMPFGLIMNGVDIVNSNDPALNIQSHKRVSVTLVEGASNRLGGGIGFISEEGGEDMKAAFFSEGQLIFSGKGSLTVISRYRHAICSDNYIRINGGTFTIPMSANDGLHANEYIEINDGTIEINSIGDGMDSEGHVLITGGSIFITTTGDKGHGIKSATETTIQSSGDIKINVTGDASKAFKCGGDMLISQGNLSLTTSGDASYDDSEGEISSASGIKCNSNLTVNGGAVIINSTGLGGKGISVEGKLTINNGEIAVIATGDAYKQSDNTKAKAIKNDGDLIINDGLIYADCKTDNAIDTKGSMSITGGTVIGVGRELTKKAFECAKTFSISGGTLVGTGGVSGLPTASACTQYVVNYSGGITQNTYLTITSSAGNNILTYQSPYTQSKAFILFSSPELARNANYTLTSGGAISGGSSFYGLYNGATHTGGTVCASFTITSMITNLNN